MKKKYLFALFSALLLACIGKIMAQTTPDSRGRDFYFTFLPNYHATEFEDKDSLFIFIAATEPTKGTIRYRNRTGTVVSKAFTITDINRMFILALPWENFELVGYNDGGNLISNSQNGTVAPQSFYVTADRDITVYALNQAVKTSDAMMILPTDVLGTDYLVLSYPSDGKSSDVFGLSRESTPSQFAVVASQNNTHITITPSAPVLNNSTAPINITLNAGDSYLLQAAISSDNLRPDLTGTRVTSDKPVALFAGQQRSTLPVASSSLLSRDYLIEQLPPVSTWGKRYVLTPFPLPTDASRLGTDLYRVLAAEDNTVVMVNDQKRATLNAGEFFEAPLTDASTITASQNVLVAQYKKSASVSSSSTALSDPFMLIVPPVRQYLKSYLCINAQAYENRSTVYKQQYMTIICPSAFLSTVRVDDKPVSTSLFKTAGTSCYSYAWLPMTDGPHRIEAATEIGIYMYGYGEANSYGYTGGMAFRTDEVNRIAFSVSTDRVAVAPNDTLAFNLKATSNDWSSIALTSMKLEFSYKTAWMQPADTILNGLALDSTWRVQATERAGKTPEERTLVITASGTTPVMMSGTVATVRMVMYLSDELHYTPSLHVTANNSDFCLEVTSQSTSVDLSLCAANLRPVRLTGEKYEFFAHGNGNELHINYGVGLAAPVRFEIFDRLGQLIHSTNTTTRSPGSYEEVLDLGPISSGLYFVRYSSGPYTQTQSVMIGQ